MDRFCGFCGARRQVQFDCALDSCSKCKTMPFIQAHEATKTTVLRCSVCTTYICALTRYCEICGHTVERSRSVRVQRAATLAANIDSKRREAIQKRKQRKVDVDGDEVCVHQFSPLATSSPTLSTSVSFSLHDDDDLDIVMAQLPLPDDAPTDSPAAPATDSVATDSAPTDSPATDSAPTDSAADSAATGSAPTDSARME
ncbi:hypothetical protein PPYR_12651 [Photinus pyralis]|uniref:Uncharacterized protein n=1 Tax=Photinus pyralis TaxID=7054 RepID=A0A5N4A6T9_PHOPY|nr:uncharacterized protein LOC116178885 [Photinus pyralis]KAB0793031.1 hypothetical protein PPYR_12651 [Photinus pyralis]